MFAVDPGPIKKMIASDEKQLNAALTVALDVFRHVDLITYPNIDRDSGLFLMERSVFADLSIMRESHADLVPAFPQLPR